MTRAEKIEAARKRFNKLLRDLGKLNDELEYLQLPQIRLDSSTFYYARAIDKAHARATAQEAG